MVPVSSTHSHFQALVQHLARNAVRLVGAFVQHLHENGIRLRICCVVLCCATDWRCVSRPECLELQGVLPDTSELGLSKSSCNPVKAPD